MCYCFPWHRAATYLLWKEFLDAFRSIAGLCVNYTKSKVLPLAGLKPRPWFHKSPLAKAKDKIKYLGMYIGNTPSSVYTLNYPPLIDKVIKELEAWQNLPLSLFERAHLFRMT